MGWGVAAPPRRPPAFPAPPRRRSPPPRADVVNVETFRSLEGKSKHQMWLELCDLVTKHPNEVAGMRVDAILRSGIRRFTDEVRPEGVNAHARAGPLSRRLPALTLASARPPPTRPQVGRLWTSLADYYIRRGMFERARDVYEEGLTSVMTVRDFSLVFDALTQVRGEGRGGGVRRAAGVWAKLFVPHRTHAPPTRLASPTRPLARAQFEESLISAKMEQAADEDEAPPPDEGDTGEDFLLRDTGDDLDLRWVAGALACVCVGSGAWGGWGGWSGGGWAHAQRCEHGTPVATHARTCRLVRLEHLMERRPELLSSVMLRQNPHNVHEWHKRAKLFAGNPTKQILAYTGGWVGGLGDARRATLHACGGPPPLLAPPLPLPPSPPPTHPRSPTHTSQRR